MRFAHGFNLFAGRRIAGNDKRKREHVIRYMARPPIPNGVTHIKFTGVEREIREPAIGRKNYLFAGSVDAPGASAFRQEFEVD